MGDGSVVKVFTWADFVALGDGVADAQLDQRVAAQHPGNCCAIIYTSGTTGDPKGVMISHDNIIFESSAVLSMVDFLGATPGSQERIISYLPLSHVAGMMVDVIMPMYITYSRP